MFDVKNILFLGKLQTSLVRFGRIAEVTIKGAQ
jgi:hypothetical protein